MFAAPSANASASQNRRVTSIVIRRSDFVDHEEIKFGNKAYLALVIIDGASNLLWATALTRFEAPETLGAFRQWTEENNCVPKGVVGDQAFFPDQFMAYCKLHGITLYPCGPRTPWPNRAETAVRLFKRTWSIMAKALADESYAEKVTVRQAVKKLSVDSFRLFSFGDSYRKKTTRSV